MKKAYPRLFNILSLPLVAVALASCSSGFEKLSRSLSANDANDNVYVLPQHKLVVPKKINVLDLPEPGSKTKTNDDFVHGYMVTPKAKSAQVIAPPKGYDIPAKTAPIGDPGQDEAVKKRLMEERAKLMQQGSYKDQESQ